jgi:3-hydroxybutyryl-CoA dehydrogenase
MDIQKIFVVGCGFMGNGIAQVAAAAGNKVKMCDLDEGYTAAGVEAIRNSLGKFLAKDKINTEQYDATLANIETTTDIRNAADADLVVEAVFENRELKLETFEKLDKICPSHTILASNTSAIPISSIAAATSRPDKVVGIHFFGPVPLMRLVEIIRGLLTSDEILRAADEWARSLGKETVLVAKDHAGFVANRGSIPSSLEAIRMVDEGMASPEDIDRATGGYDFGVGPLQIIDNAGLDVSMNAAMAIYDDTHDPKFFPPPLLRRMVSAGLIGRKAGKGFYDYASGKRESYILLDKFAKESVAECAARRGALLQRFITPNMLEAMRLLEGGIASAEDIDKAYRLGFNLPQGFLEIADSLGLDEVLESALAFYEQTGESKFHPPLLLKSMVAEGRLGRKTGKGFYHYS